MGRLRKLAFVRLLGALLCAQSVITLAESGILVVHVKDVQERPVAGVQIGVTGDGGSPTTGDDGKARIPLAKQTKENDWVRLQILKSPPGKDFMMVSPWDYGTFVPSFANESKNVIEIVVVQRGDRVALLSGTVLKAFTEKIQKVNPNTVDKQAPQVDQNAGLAAVAKQYGLDPGDLDGAIRAWGTKATDRYEVGLAALYGRHYPKASAQLADSLQKREENFAADQEAVAEAAFFLGQSLFEEGKYRESVTVYQRCLDLQPDDATVLNNLAVSLTGAGDYAAAEPLYGRALAIREKALSPDHPDVAQSLNNLGLLLKITGDYAGAEPLYRRALAIMEKLLGPDDPNVVLNNFASLLQARGDYAGAEPRLRRALAVDEKALGPDHPDVAADLNNLASLLYDKGEYTGAEPLCRRALAIDEKALGPDHPLVATDLSNLASVVRNRGNDAGAEPLLRRALAIDEKVLGLKHPTTQTIRRNLESLGSKSLTEKSEK
jgi:tetratricopeptide (TPR) repeat protein